MRIITINLNGIRSAANKGFFAWLAEQDADIVCLQELKAQAADMTQQMLAPAGYHGYLHYAEKRGYSGATLFRSRAADYRLHRLIVDERPPDQFCSQGKPVTRRPPVSTGMTTAILRFEHRLSDVVGRGVKLRCVPKGDSQH